MNGILGKKIGMTQVFDAEGQVIPVTVLRSGPCFILQIKTKEKDGYTAVQLGFEEIKESKVKKPRLGKFKQIKVTPTRYIKEIRVADHKNYQVGQQIDLTQFNPGDLIDVVATSIGRGFQGGVKRWGWSIGPKSHGSMSHRAPGSIGASAFPSRVVKGHHLPGHMGNHRVTIQNLEVIKVDKENNLLVVKGSVPGPKNSFLIIKKSPRKKVKIAKPSVKTEPEKPKKEKPAKDKK